MQASTTTSAAAMLQCEIWAIPPTTSRKILSSDREYLLVKTGFSFCRKNSVLKLEVFVCP
jgi:hypothetical protein